MRVDWQGLLADPQLKPKKLDYKPTESRQDLKAEQVLKGVDGLGQEARAVYDVLSEFSHPNVGFLFGLTESMSLPAERDGALWITKVHSLNPPLAAVSVLGPVLERIFNEILEVMQHFEQLLIRAGEMGDNLLSLSQAVVRDAVHHAVFNRYAACPCGSGAKIKFCCGKRLRG